MSTSQFGRYNQNPYSSSSNYSPSSNNSYHYASNNLKTNSNNKQSPANNIPKIGSYRVREYDCEKLPTILNTFPVWKESTPLCISLRQQTLHLTPIELRAEDYYNIRTKNLEERHHKNFEKQWLNRSFNSALTSNDAMTSLKQVSSFKQGPYNTDSIISLSKGNINGNITNNNGYNNSMFRNNTNSNNPFSNNNTNTANPFSNNSSSTGYNTRSSNPFNNNNTGNISNNNGNPFTNNNATFDNRANNNSNSNNNNPFNNNTNNNNMSNTRNMFNNTSNNSTPFNINSSNNNSNNNPFNGNNMFNKNTNITNPFNNTNSNNNNPFNNNNTNNNNTSNNPFNNNNNNNNSNNNSNNLFNNSNSNNPFNNTNSNNNNNPFNNNSNNNNGNNMFNNNNNRGNNNLFNNGNTNNGSSNNNNNSNNLFNNNRNNGNNLFNNTSNNSNPFSNNSNNGGSITQYTIMQMMHMMQTCIDRALTNNNNTMGMFSINNNSAGPNNQLFGTLSSGYPNDMSYSSYTPSENINKKYAEWFLDPFQHSSNSLGYGVNDYMMAKAKGKKKNNKTTLVVIKDEVNSSRVLNNIDNKTHLGFNFLRNNIQTSFNYDNERNQQWQNDKYRNGGNQTISANQYKKFCKRESQDQRQENDNLGTGSISRPNSSNYSVNFHPTNQNTANGYISNSMKSKQDNLYSSNTKSNIKSNHSLNGIKYKYHLQCVWRESLKSKQDSIQNNRKQSDTYIIEGELLLKYNPSISELNDIILDEIKEKYCEANQIFHDGQEIIIRKDATLTLEMPTNKSKHEYIIKGTLLQNKINAKKSYDYVYDSLEGWEIKNLTVVNKFGRIQWPGIINIKGVDFENDLQILENQGDVQGVLDNYDMVITFNSLPPGVAMEADDEKRARKLMEKHIKKVGQLTNDKITLINLDLKNRLYTFKVEKVSQEGEKFSN